MEFMSILKELRLEKNLSQMQLATKVNVNRGTISHWEVGRIEPNISMLKNLSNIFDVSLDYLCGRTDEPEITELYPSAILKKEEVNILRHFNLLNKYSRFLLDGFIKVLLDGQTSLTDAY